MGQANLQQYLFAGCIADIADKNLNAALVKFQFLRCFSRPYMCIVILVGNPYRACENDVFSQVSLKPPTRFSHFANGAPARTANSNFFFKYLANEKNPDHE